MVTGRVCKNILGLFSNGIKETLEVKLKLIPVPTCKQSEYMDNMERYHNLSKLMPEGLDYNAWAEFLRANPAIGQLAQPCPSTAVKSTESVHMGGLDSFHDMLARPSPSGDMNNSFYDSRRMSFSTHDTRASSPAMSTTSAYYHSYYGSQDYRPASQASFRSETALQSPSYLSPMDPGQDQAEQEPPKKRARVTKAKRPKKTALGQNTESLRVTASTAASVRLHKPVAINAGAAVSAEQVPRAPTPRPRNTGLHSHGPRLPAPSLLRNASVDEPRPYVSPYDSGMFSDNAAESADDQPPYRSSKRHPHTPESPDDERGGSSGETPQNIPSSPPLMPGRLASHTASPVPSSPELPFIPLPNDSGFVSDMTVGQTEDETGSRNAAPDPRDVSTEPDVRSRRPPDRSKRSWSELNPGPIEMLPSTFAPKIRPNQETTPLNQGLLNHFLNQAGTSASQVPYKPTAEPAGPMAAPSATDRVPFSQPVQDQIFDSFRKPESSAGASGKMDSTRPKSEVPTATSRSGTPNAPPPAPTISKSRGLSRSQTWSGEPMSDAPVPDAGKVKQPRSGSGAKRKQGQIIRDKLEQALEQGNLPTYCNNCGQIETPAWRRAYTRVEEGSPDGIVVSSKGTSITAFEVIDQEEGAPPQYRIFKQALEPEEIEADSFKTLTLCNPCGLWLNKKNAMRPHELWAKAQAQNSADKPKRKRKPKKPKMGNEETMSDAIVPDSEPIMPESRSITGPSPSAIPTLDTDASFRQRSCSFRTANDSQLDEPSARAALFRAIQSSPVGLRGDSRDTPIDLDGDLTPKPTRRLLFPSPRRPGEVKSLTDSSSFNSQFSKPATRLPNSGFEDVDKENQPPRNENEDDLAHLFDEPTPSKTTPTKNSLFEDLLKTPTPGSRRRGPLTPMRGTDVGLKSPSRSGRTPRTGNRAASLPPETPFTRQLNDILSDCLLPGSPSQFDLSTFPTFNTPGNQFGDLLSSNYLSSDLPLPSSPPKNFDFNVFEDPNTSTAALWNGASIFESSDAIMSDTHVGDQDQHSIGNGSGVTVLNLNGISLEFAAMIEDVVGTTSKNNASPVDSPSNQRPSGPELNMDAGTDENVQEQTTPGAVVGPELDMTAESTTVKVEGTGATPTVE